MQGFPASPYLAHLSKKYGQEINDNQSAPCAEILEPHGAALFQVRAPARIYAGF